jgi:hypothetical protein
MAHDAGKVIEKKHGEYMRLSGLVFIIILIALLCYINNSAETNSFIATLKISDLSP